MLIMCVIKGRQKFIIKKGENRQLKIFIIWINIRFQLDNEN